MSVYLNVLLLGLLVVTGLLTIMAPTLLLGAISLAAASAVLSALLFQMGGPLAGVFELSVCAGMITVVFVSVICLTRPLDDVEARERYRLRLLRFVPLSLLLLVVAVWTWYMPPTVDTPPPAGVATESVRIVLWDLRRLDLVGQVLIILAGVFGVVVLFHENRPQDGAPKP